MPDQIEESQDGFVQHQQQQQQQDSLSACANSYTYSTLSGKRDTRLLKFRDGPNDNHDVRDAHGGCAEPCCANIKPETPRFDLHEVIVDKAPKYEAISYAWGSSELCETVLCGSMTLLVTRSCWELLHRLQLRDHHGSSSFYWIDAICINQKSTSERSGQVTLMETIYIEADGVVVWPGYLGPSRRNSSWTIWDVFKYIRSGGAYNENSIPQMLEFIAKPYFTRIWPIQEVALARTCRLLVDDYGEVNFEQVFVVGQDGDMHRSGKASYSDLDLIRRSYAQKTEVHQKFRAAYHNSQTSRQQPHRNTSVSQMLLDVRALEATQPLDKIFAVQGMLKLLGVTLAPPDYNREVEDVYIDATIAAMTFDQDLRILAGLNGMSIDGLPSWSPDWSDHRAINETAQWEDHKAAGTGRTRFKIDYVALELKVCGLQIDVVDEKHVEFPETEVLGKHLPEFLSGPPRTLSEVWKGHYLSFLESLSLDLLRSEPTNTRSYTDIVYREAVKLYRKTNCSGSSSFTKNLFTPTTEPSHDKFKRFHVLRARLCRRLDRKWLFQTRGGRFGIASQHIQFGDSIVLLKGCNLPMIARPEGDKWTLIGPAYIPEDGIMEGSHWKDDGALQAFTFI